MEIVFYKSKEHADFYMVYKGRNGCKPEEHIKRLTNTCGFENSGYPKIEIEIGFVIKTEAPDAYFMFLIQQIATNHIPLPKYNDAMFQGWYEFKNVSNPAKWLADFYSIPPATNENPSVIQAVLF